MVAMLHCTGDSKHRGWLLRLGPWGSICWIVALHVLVLSQCTPCVAEGRTYVDYHQKEVYFLSGDLSFADEVVLYQPGSPAPAAEGAQPEQALHAPDCTPDNSFASVALGCGGLLVLKFTDNAVVDVDGPDLYVFEVGPSLDATSLSVSIDGKTWISAGVISGGACGVDLSSKIVRGEIYRFVKLEDTRSDCTGPRPGADIDAVGTTGSVIQISIKSSVLFASNESVLKPEAKQEIQEAARKITDYPGAHVIIEGHTDSIGDSAYNQVLSRARAEAVRAYMEQMEGLTGFAFECRGYGETQPVASNDTREGREKNRRVEITIVPGVK